MHARNVKENLTEYPSNLSILSGKDWEYNSVRFFFPRCVLVDGNRTFNLDGFLKKVTAKEVFFSSLSICPLGDVGIKVKTEVALVNTFPWGTHFCESISER